MLLKAMCCVLFGGAVEILFIMRAFTEFANGKTGFLGKTYYV